MKKLSRIVVLCLTLILALGMTFVLTACDEETEDTTISTTPTYKVSFVLSKPDGTEAYSTSVSGLKAGKSVSKPTDISLDDEAFAGYDESIDSIVWYSDAECTTPYDFSTKISSSFTLYAKLTSNGKSTDAAISANAALTEQKVNIRKVGEDGTGVTESVSLGIWKIDVANDISVYDFKEKFAGICSSAKASFKVYTDEECKYVAGQSGDKSQNVTLSNGDNYYWLKISAEDSRASEIYKINVYREPLYTVVVQPIEGDNSNNIVYEGKTALRYGDLISKPDITGLNIGYTPDKDEAGNELWYYYTKEKRNEEGQIVNEAGDVLIIENGVYYVSDGNGNKLFAYQDANGKTVVREGQTYYREGDSEKTPLTSDELYNVIDENGLPTYEVGTPITGAGSYRNVWNFAKTKVTENYTHIFCKWTQQEFTVVLKFSEEDANAGAKFGGQNANRTSITFTVSYNASANNLASLIKSATVVDPVKDYASFDGWYYGDARMVGANSTAVSGFSIISSKPVEFIAKFIDNTYTVNVSAGTTETNISADVMAKTLTPDATAGAKYKNGATITLGAEANEGYELIGWKKNNKDWTGYAGTLENPQYTLDIDDVKNGVVSFTAIFKAKELTIEFVNGTDEAEIKVKYNSEMSLEQLPEVELIDKTNNLKLVGWYYTETDNNDTPVAVVENGVLVQKITNWTKDVTVNAVWEDYNFKFIAYAYMPNTKAGEIKAYVGDDESDWNNAEKWTAINNTLLKYNGKQSTVNNGDVVNLVATTKDTHFEFVGWYSINSKGELTSISTELTTTVTIEDADAACVAVWKYKDVEITFTNSKKTIESVTRPFNTTTGYLPLPAGTSANPDEEFVGWFDSEGAQYTDNVGNPLIAITNEEYIENGLELTAKFKKINYFEVDGNTITGLTEAGLNKDTLDIIFDDSITTIADGAFYGNTNIISITIHSNITSIGSYAFAGSVIQTVKFGSVGETFKGLTIGEGAFSDCEYLESVELPKNMNISKFVSASVAANSESEPVEGIFSGTNLKSLSYPGNVVLGALFTTVNPYNSNWYAVVQGGVTYYIPESLVDVTINTNSVNKVVDYAFKDVKLTTVTLSDLTTIIGNYAFANSGATEGEANITVVGLENIETIGNYAFKGSDIVINDNLGDAATTTLQSVKSMGVGVFMNTQNVTNINLKDAPITTIESNVFENSNIVGINLKGIKAIKNSAFKNAKKFTTLTNATGVETIGSKAFYGCSETTDTATTGLEDVSGFDNVISIGEYAFDNTKYFIDRENAADGTKVIGKVLYFAKGAVTVPSNVVIIAPYAMSAATSADFSGATALQCIDTNAFNNSAVTSVTMPASLLKIYNNAFTGAKVATVDLSSAKNLCFIGQSAFENCTALNTLTFATPVVNETSKDFDVFISIYDKAFKGCTSLTAVILPDNLAKLGAYAFAESTLSSVTFVDDAKFDTSATYEDVSVAKLISTIEEGTFAGTAINTITLPLFITEIGDYAFEKCLSLTSITNLGNNGYYIASVGDYAFNGCTSLLTFNILVKGEESNSACVSSVGKYAFENCTSLTSISFGSVYTFADGVFKDCTSLTKVVGASSATVGKEAFKNCKALTSCADYVSSVGESAFEGCINISSIAISGGTSIGAKAFSGCIGLNSITIPSSVTAIGDSAFAGCVHASAITFSGSSLKTIGIASFADCSAVKDIVLPDAVTTIGTSAFEGCSSLENIQIGTKITSIGANAFASIDNLNIKFTGKTVPTLESDIYDSVASANNKIYVLEGYAASFKAQSYWENYTFVEYIA